MSWYSFGLFGLLYKHYYHVNIINRIEEQVLPNFALTRASLTTLNEEIEDL